MGSQGQRVVLCYLLPTISKLNQHDQLAFIITITEHLYLFHVGACTLLLEHPACYSGPKDISMSRPGGNNRTRHQVFCTNERLNFCTHIKDVAYQLFSCALDILLGNKVNMVHWKGKMRENQELYLNFSAQLLTCHMTSGYLFLLFFPFFPHHWRIYSSRDTSQFIKCFCSAYI